MNWTPVETHPAPAMATGETPKRYLTRLERWSCDLLGRYRKALREAGDPSPLRRYWRGFVLTVERGSRE